MVEDGERKFTFIMPQDNYDILEGYARERGPKYPVTLIINEAIDQYIRKRQHPEFLIQEMQQALRENPAILLPVIRDEVREQVQSQLRQLLGEKYPSEIRPLL